MPFHSPGGHSSHELAKSSSRGENQGRVGRTVQNTKFSHLDVIQAEVCLGRHVIPVLHGLYFLPQAGGMLDY